MLEPYVPTQPLNRPDPDEALNDWLLGLLTDAPTKPATPEMLEQQVRDKAGRCVVCNARARLFGLPGEQVCMKCALGSPHEGWADNRLPETLGREGAAVARVEAAPIVAWEADCGEEGVWLVYAVSADHAAELCEPDDPGSVGVRRLSERDVPRHAVGVGERLE